jgi:hypothetical protein
MKSLYFLTVFGGLLGSSLYRYKHKQEKFTIIKIFNTGFFLGAVLGLTRYYCDTHDFYYLYKALNN